MVVATPLDAACYRAAPPSVVQRLLEHKAYISASQGSGDSRISTLDSVTFFDIH